MSEDTFYEMKIKFEKLHSLLALCDRQRIRLYADEKLGYLQLKSELESVLEVDLSQSKVVKQVLTDNSNESKLIDKSDECVERYVERAIKYKASIQGDPTDESLPVVSIQIGMEDERGNSDNI